MKARIFQPAKSALQAGRSNMKKWRLEFEPAGRKKIDYLMGWTGSELTGEQVQLEFETKEAAIRYANSKNLDFSLHEPQQRSFKVKSYSGNFSRDIREPWTH